MPRYGHYCAACDEHFEDWRTMAESSAPAACPKCGELAPRTLSTGVGGAVSAESTDRYNGWFNSAPVQAKLKSGEYEIPSKSADVRHL